MNTLVFLSGGLDSTVALVKLLKETDDNIHAHHIHLMNSEGRHEAEAEAVSKIVPYCQKIRSFKYTETTQDYRQIGLPYDVHITRFTAAQICRYGGIDRVVSGKCKNDTNPLDISETIFNVCLCGNPQGISWHFPVEHMTKYDEKIYLEREAAELLKFIHYCRKPKKINGEWTNCNKCNTCRQSIETELHYIFKNYLS